MMKKIREYSVVYLIGALGYGMLETLWRGFTHWSMLLTGGTCFLWIYVVNFKKLTFGFWKKCMTGACIITLTEFVVGIIVNRIFRLNVWDYSGKRHNIFGQICVQYSILWFLLCIPVTMLCKRLKKTLIST